MTPSIRVSEETKEKLEAVKRDGETFDGLLARLTVDRTEADVEELAGIAGTAEIVESMAQAREDLNDSLS
jgi:predicted CopG family antitoxin